MYSLNLEYRDYVESDSTYSDSYKALAIDVTSDYGLRKLDTSKQHKGVGIFLQVFI